MTTIYVNGGAPDYRGEIFQTSGELLDKLESNLTTAGWILVTKEAGQNILMKGRSENDHMCYVEFKISDESSVGEDVKSLGIRGYQGLDLIQGSPDGALKLEFRENGVNRFWLTADIDAGCLCIFGSHKTSTVGAHFGFLNRIDKTDPYAWMVGWIHGWGYLYAYVAKSKHDGTNWRRLADTIYYMSGNDPWSYVSVVPQSCFDALTRGKPYYEYDSSSGYNPYYYPQRGRLNYNGLPLIDRYCYTEGRGSTGDYASTGARMYFRGYVKFAYCGVSNLSSNTIIEDPLSSKVILSVGDVDWQGMRIA